MRCEKCGVEMIVYAVKKKEGGGREVIYACRNKNCPDFDKRLAKKAPVENEQQ